jgi:hypothetical protein
MNDVILFGAGKIGEYCFNLLKDEYNIIAFADNDKTKHGRTFCGIKVISPCEINKYGDVTVIITLSCENEIRNQLTNELRLTNRIRSYTMYLPALNPKKDMNREFKAVSGNGELIDVIYPNRDLRPWQIADCTNVSRYIHVVRHVMTTIGSKKRCCVEFGAWDGMQYSNVRPLIIEDAWNACLIESDTKKYRQLVENYRLYENVKTVNRTVGWDRNENLDCILNENGFTPDEVAVVFIDIDGNDYHVWEALQLYNPDLIVIEYNKTIPNDVIYIQPRKSGVNRGSSLQALIRLGKEKGYELIAAPMCDAFFVKKEHYPLFGLTDNSAHSLNDNDSYVTHLFQTGEGELMCAGNNLLSWHGIPFTMDDIQPLPKSLRFWCAEQKQTIEKLLSRNGRGK